MPARMARRTCVGSAKSRLGGRGALSADRSIGSISLIVKSSADSSGGPQPGKSAFEVVDQITDILKPNVDANRGARRLPPRAGPQSRWISGHHQAFVSAPAVTELEKIHVIEERGECTVGTTFQCETEQAGSAKKVALPDAVPGIFGQSRVMDSVDLRTLLQPRGDRMRGFLVPAK